MHGRRQLLRSPPTLHRYNDPLAEVAWGLPQPLRMHRRLASRAVRLWLPPATTRTPRLSCPSCWATAAASPDAPPPRRPRRCGC